MRQKPLDLHFHDEDSEKAYRVICIRSLIMAYCFERPIEAQRRRVKIDAAV